MKHTCLHIMRGKKIPTFCSSILLLYNGAVSPSIILDITLPLEWEWQRLLLSFESGALLHKLCSKTVIMNGMLGQCIKFKEFHCSFNLDLLRINAFSMWSLFQIFFFKSLLHLFCDGYVPWWFIKFKGFQWFQSSFIRDRCIFY